MPKPETASELGVPPQPANLMATRALAAATALAAAADDVDDGVGLGGLRSGDRRVVVQWLRDRAELLTHSVFGAARCTADDGFGRCWSDAVVDGFCPRHAAEDRRLQLVVDQLVVDDGCPACHATLSVRAGLIVCNAGCDLRVDDGDDLAVDDAGMTRLGVAVVAAAWLVAMASWTWLMVVTWRAFIRWAAA